MSSSLLWPLRRVASDPPPSAGGGRLDLHPFKVKSILKSDQQQCGKTETARGRQAAGQIPDVTSFFLDKDEGTLV